MVDCDICVLYYKEMTLKTHAKMYTFKKSTLNKSLKKDPSNL